MREVLAIADDLSGAAEVAQHLGGALHLAAGRYAGVAVVDLDTRHLPPDEAARRVAEALSRATPQVVFQKVDSLLRGNLAAEVGAVRAAGRAVVVAPAVPSGGRVVLDGVPHIDGVPLGETAAWHLEAQPPPATLAEALRPLPTRPVGLAEVRSGPRAAFGRAIRDGEVPVCDAVTDDDLDRIVDAALELPAPALVGSGGLAAALGRRLGPPPLLVVVGTAAPSAREQVDRLVADGATHVELGADKTPTDIERALAHGPVVLTPQPGIVPGRARELAGALGRLVGAVPSIASCDLVLTGGETARRVLEALRVNALRPIGEIHPGAVHSVTGGGRSVVTRPGSFGGPDSLVHIVRTLRGGRAGMPLIAVTMGDGAGVGPEVVVEALLDARVRAACRPVVIGDAGRLRRAAAVRGRSPRIEPIAAVRDADFTPDRINVIDLGLLPADLPWGQVSAVAGDAAYQYVRVACELAVAGRVQAICTAPLNKEALHAGGHVYPGHTELLAELTGTPEVSMLLAAPRLKVVHVTTHIGLLDAVERIEPGLVERTIRRGHEALVRSGRPRPKIGVCGINPHAGENGLFGRGEEATKIEPGVAAARAAGIDVTGPLPADTLFFLAARGDYDLVVAMYHDQGHGPVKVLGIDAGVNITIGLPVVRTSVDHGTAFDIAGTGKADAASMVEALLQAAAMAGFTG
jgi:4-hydroxythreonine-4-phosphate dehydrogenase